MYFNRQCLKQGIVPKYANIKIGYTSPASSIIQSKMQTTHIKDEIKYLYKKKDLLNKSLYKTHLQAAQEWGSTWHLIRESVRETINTEFEKKYKILGSKLC
jgi:hypothetical protein